MCLLLCLFTPCFSFLYFVSFIMSHIFFKFLSSYILLTSFLLSFPYLYFILLLFKFILSLFSSYSSCYSFQSRFAMTSSVSFFLLNSLVTVFIPSILSFCYFIINFLSQLHYFLSLNHVCVLLSFFRLLIGTFPSLFMSTVCAL